MDNVYALCRKFVWSTKYLPIAWKMLCKPIVDGGLGLKDLSAWNKALIAKTLWKIHSKKDTLCIKWINHEYSKYVSVWCWEWKRDDSPLIKRILEIRDVLVQRKGSVVAAMDCLRNWFDGPGDLSSAYDFFVHSTARWPWKPLLMKTTILPKHRFIMWLFAHRKLLTRLVFVDIKVCSLCNAADESMDHLFFNCTISAEIWRIVRIWVGMRKVIGSASAVLIAFLSVYRGSTLLAKMRHSALAVTVYHVWDDRNKAMFDNEKLSIDTIIKKIKILIFRCHPVAIDFPNIIM